MWVGRGAKSAAEYAVGDRSQAWWLILFSIVATETSAVTFLSIPGFAYGRDLTWLQIAVGFLLGRFAGRPDSAARLFPRFALHRLRGAQINASAALPSGRPRCSSSSPAPSPTACGSTSPAIVVQEMTGFSLALAVIGCWASRPSSTPTSAACAPCCGPTSRSSCVYLAGALDRLRHPARRACPAGSARYSSARRAAGKLRVIDPSSICASRTRCWAGLDRRHLHHLRVARRRPDDGAALPLGPRAGGCAAGAASRAASWSCCSSRCSCSSALGLWAFYQDHPPAAGLRSRRSRVRPLHPRRAADRPGRASPGCDLRCGHVELPQLLRDHRGARHLAAVGRRRAPRPERELRLTRVLTVGLRRRADRRRDRRAAASPRR